MTASRARRLTLRRRRLPWSHSPPSSPSRPCMADDSWSWSSPLDPRPRPPPPRSSGDGVTAAAADTSPSSPPLATLPLPPPPPPCTTDDLQTTSTAITAPPHRHRCGHCRPPSPSRSEGGGVAGAAPNMLPAPPPTVPYRDHPPQPSTLVPRPASQGPRTLKKNAALPSALTPSIAYAPSAATTFPIHSTTSSARNLVDIGAAPVDFRQRERPRPLEKPRDPQPHNPPCEHFKGRRSLRPLRLHFRQVPKKYASVTTSAPVNPPSRPRKHRTFPHVQCVSIHIPPS